jgi:hypothetical protein
MTPSAQTAGGRRVRRWTRETIIEKILEWDARYGEPPCSADWNPSLARWRAQEWRVERYHDGVWPSTNAAKRPFGGSFDAAVRAAGLEPHRPGPRRGAGEARPAVAPRPERPTAAAPVDDSVALDRARRAEARVAALERELLIAEGRAERAESKSADARRRARRAGERRPRERVRVARRDARTDALERMEAVIADADARVRASEDQVEAAVRDTADARRAAATAERRARELSGLVANGQRRLTGEELSALRAGGPSGPAVLAAALRRLTKARAAGDRAGLRGALGEIASAAVRWHDRL